MAFHSIFPLLFAKTKVKKDELQPIMGQFMDGFGDFKDFKVFKDFKDLKDSKDYQARPS